MFSSMVEALKKMEKGFLEEAKKSRPKRMYEIGKKRPDGKFNIWTKVQLGHYWEWVVDMVCDSIEEAIEYTLKKNKARAKR